MNCNTTHYRANSSSVPGDPTLAIGFTGIVILLMTCFAAWITHIYVCLADDRWGFLVAGAIFFPIAVVHGIGHWFGLW